MNNISDYQATSTDWRKQLRLNERRTFFVIALFVLIYAAVGLLIDVYMQPVGDDVPISLIIFALITFKITPTFTLLLAGIAVVSIFITFSLHDRIMLLGTEYYEVTPKTARSLSEKQLYNVVDELRIAAGLRYMPKVYLIEADYMNAFASGYSEKSALVAITRGLLEKLERSELQAVMAHELSHVRHHDIKLTLMASVLSNIMIIAIDILFRSMIFGGRRRRDESGEGGGGGIVAIIVLLRFLLPIITVLLLLYLSRTREFKADAGAVELMRDNTPLGKALIKISADHEENKEKYELAYQATAHEDIRREAYIFDPTQMGISIQQSISSFFSTHPPLNARLKAIGLRIKDQG